MIVKYGPYQHSQNEVSIRITREPMRSQGGLFYAYKERWDCQGLLLNYATQQNLTNAIQQLTAAYSVDGNNLVLYLDDGITPTAHALISANCNGGTRVVQAPSFPDTLGTAEYQPAAGRSYSFAIEGKWPSLAQTSSSNSRRAWTSRGPAARWSSGSPSRRAIGSSSKPPRRARIA
jgi:hypothetical protein